ncbi:MAG: alanine--tRNA ligase [Endozoicomonas sp. (ex Botrylloides leachii)]|nr:alanine--tRNA ligase [Endozoicomonas sp. (ex Botrylloides leachii)]
MKSSDIRSAFLDFFKERGHQVVASSSLVPDDDPTLLFTNAGMNQFKNTFLGRERRAYTRAATSQKCVRAGGKHNDLENVGYTARHHTFFEMLGNFSFGDYFKKEAIAYGWQFLTEVVKLPKEKLCVTVYEADNEAYAIWLNDIGIPEDSIIRIGDNKGAPYASDNFWQMGDSGPCGPCTEVFYDHGDHIPGGRPGTPEEEGDRFIEIWNMVFMQFNRSSDGQMIPLPKPSIDTGMGLERLAAILQGVHSNYEIDIFQALLRDAATILNDTIALTDSSLRVIADHIRSCAFLLADGVMPANDGRGYTLRRIIRRACRHGHKLGATDAFFYKLVASLVRIMGDAYPELKEQQRVIENTLLKEEEQFIRTLDKGMGLLKASIANLKGSIVPGDIVFTLYDTYGFPVDLTQDIVRERNMTVDMAGFDSALEAQRQRARAASKFGVNYNDHLIIEGKTEFTGYNTTSAMATVQHLFIAKKNGSDTSLESTDQVSTQDKEVVAVVDTTPFYAESGGQVGDTGFMRWGNQHALIADTQKQGAVFIHTLRNISASLRVGQVVELEVSAEKRMAIALNHSATHLLHAALRQLLGTHVTQKGSLVDAERLRFDFSHPKAVTVEQLREVEMLVNRQIRANTPVKSELMSMEEAKAKGAMALFGEKYTDEVRVLTMGENCFSVELCGGIHAERTGDIGSIRIIGESGIASGIRRIEAVSGYKADSWVQSQLSQLQTVSHFLKTKPEDLLTKVGQLIKEGKDYEREILHLKQKLSSQNTDDLISQAVTIKGVKLLATTLAGVDAKSLRGMVDQLKNKLGTGVIVLAAPNEGKIPLAAGVTAELTGRVKAGDLLKMVAMQIGGKGGGRPDFAQGGGSQPENLPTALDSVAAWLEERI